MGAPEDDGIWFDGHQSLSFADEMRYQTTAIRNVLTTLETNLSGIVNEWRGADRDAYFNHVQPAWEREVTALSTILDKHAETLENINDLYKQTVDQNAQGLLSVKF